MAFYMDDNRNMNSTLVPGGLDRLVSVIPRAPRAPRIPSRSEIRAHYAKIKERQKELDEIKAAMALKHAAVTAKPGPRRR